MVKMQNFGIWIHTMYSLVHVKAADIYKGITEDVEKRFDTSNYESDRPLP